MVGSIRLPSIAVVAMVEPEIAENTVPATMAMTESRPGTRRISSAKASIALSATPVWNSTSPISTKNGIGVSEKLVTDGTALRASCDSPGSPPRNKQRADDVEREERERDRQPEAHQRDEAAEQDEARRRPSPCASPPSVASMPPARLAVESGGAKRNTNSTASSAKQSGSGASSHHSGNTRFLMVIEPSRRCRPSCAAP